MTRYSPISDQLKIYSWVRDVIASQQMTLQCDETSSNVGKRRYFKSSSLCCTKVIHISSLFSALFGVHMGYVTATIIVNVFSCLLWR